MWQFAYGWLPFQQHCKNKLKKLYLIILRKIKLAVLKKMDIFYAMKIKL
jgi:hypothetical protein